MLDGGGDADRVQNVTADHDDPPGRGRKFFGVAGDDRHGMPPLQRLGENAAADHAAGTEEREFHAIICPAPAALQAGRTAGVGQLVSVGFRPDTDTVHIPLSGINPDLQLPLNSGKMTHSDTRLELRAGVW